MIEQKQLAGIMASVPSAEKQRPQAASRHHVDLSYESPAPDAPKQLTRLFADVGMWVPVLLCLCLGASPLSAALTDAGILLPTA